MIVLPNEFIDFIQQHGITPPRGARVHDKPTRFDVKTGKVDSGASGWLVLFSDEQGGVIGDWATGMQSDWQAQKVSTMTQAEREAMLRERTKKQAEQEAKDKADHEQAKILAITEYKKALIAEGLNIKYLLRKYVSNFSAKIDDNQALMLPMRDLLMGDLVSYQRISTTEEGSSQKRFASGVKLSRLDAYGLIINSYDLDQQTRLNDLQEADTVYIVEGVATGCTVWEAMQKPVICAFSSGSLLSVAKATRSALPDAKIVLCADNDKSGIGISKARQAAQAVGGVVVIASGINGTDFNDDFSNALKSNGQNRGEALATVRDSILQQQAQDAPPRGESVTDNAPITKPNLSVMAGLDAQIMVVCETQAASDLAGKLARHGIVTEPKADMLTLKAQIKTKTMLINKVETLCPVVWLAFGDSEQWLNKAHSLGMMTLNDIDLANVAHKKGVKAVADGINQALAKALPTNTPKIGDRPLFADITRTGKPLNTLENWQTLLEWEGVKLRYNIMQREVEFRTVWRGGGDIKNTADISRLASAGERYELKHGGTITSTIRTLASETAYHPVRDWIERDQWDGIDRIRELCATLVTDSEIISDDFKATLLARWMIGAVQAIMTDRPQAQHGVIVLQGNQGIGKGRWAKALCPIENAVKDGLKIDAGNVDSVRQATRHWIAELGELDGTFRKSDIAHLKAFLTQESESYRLPYAMTIEDYPRRTAFIASVNESQYLIDETGNRRFWTIPVISINYDHQINMQQVWAQVKTLYDKGQQWWLTDIEMKRLNELNKGYEAVNPYHEAIMSAFYFDQTDKFSKMMTSTDIARQCGYTQPDRKVSTGFAKALRAMGIEDKMQKVRGVAGRFFAMPECR